MSRIRAEEEVDECSSPPQNVRLENFTQVADRGGFRPPLHVPIRPCRKVFMIGYFEVARD